MIQDRKVVGDVIRYELYYDYCREAETVKNTAGETITLSSPVGYPVYDRAGQMEFLLAGSEVYVAGLLAEQDPFDALADDAISPKKAILVRGPAIIDRDQLPTEDVMGDEFDLDAIEAALLALNPPIICRREPPTTSIQSE